MIRALIFCSLSLFVCSCGGTFRPSAGTNTGTIIGTLTDAKTGEPTVGVSIAVKGTKFGAITDDHGTFVIERLPTGRYVLIVSSIDHQKVEISPVEVRTGQTTRVDRKLEKVEGDMTLSK